MGYNMPLSLEGKNLLIQGAATFGVNLRADVRKFDCFYDFLLEANRQTNLTSITDEGGVILKHFVDSISCVSGGYLEGPLRVMDMGTGAGFPGIPLCIVKPALTMILLDATRRKANFVDKVVNYLHLGNAQVLWGRAEEVGKESLHRARYDRVVTRAVGSLSTLYELSLPLLKVGGYLIAQKGPEAAREVQNASVAAEELGGRLIETIPMKLPLSGDSRLLVIVEKTSPTPDKYPRRPGIPQKNPLF